MISLALNGIDIDWGKNRYWTSHHWLFPPGSITQVEYQYAHGIVERKPGLETTLNETYFRLRHLGYSQHETETKFEAVVSRWNRTADLRLSFSDFRRALAGVDLASLTSKDLKPHAWDFYGYLLNRLAHWDTEHAFLEDFIRGLDVALTLRVLAESAENRSLPLRWHHQDLVDSGWVTLEDLTDIDRPTFMVNHTVLYGRLQEYAGATRVGAFDNWLANKHLARETSYTEMRPDGTVAVKKTTLPTAVRNMIHHPENPHNMLSDDNLRESIELLLRVVKLLPNPLPGLA